MRPCDAVIAATTVMLAACSLFSGWGGLEGGACRDCDGGADGAGAAGDASSAGDGPLDASTGPTSDAAGHGVVCGAATCDVASGQGCCVQGAGGGTCSNSTQCMAALFLACDSSSQCTGGAVCCFDFGLSNGASCQSTCAGTVLCSPQSPGDCAGPKRCRLGAVPPGYYTCQ